MAIGTRSSAIAVGPRDAVLVSSCYVSRGMAVSKVSINKSDLQGHWHWCHWTGHILFPISLSLQLCLCLAPLTRYYHFIFQNVKRSRDSEHIPFGDNILKGKWRNG